jgi:hypothetical protein
VAEFPRKEKALTAEDAEDFAEIAEELRGTGKIGGAN